MRGTPASVTGVELLPNVGLAVSRYAQLGRMHAALVHLRRPGCDGFAPGIAVARGFVRAGPSAPATRQGSRSRGGRSLCKHLQTPICIHRAPLSTHERFIGFLIEHFGGNFPLWLAPTQVAVLPVSDKVNGYASSITKKLIDSDIRAVLDDRSDKIGAKIRNAEISRTNVMLIVGPKEQENNTVSVRRKFSGDLGTVDQDMLISELIKEIKDRSLTHS